MSMAARAPAIEGTPGKANTQEVDMTDTNADTRPRAPARPHQRSGSAWRYAVAGLSASLVGLGLARFSYTPLIPALIAAKWFSASDVVYLGAANLAGYLAGALAARTVAARIGAVHALRAMMGLATLSFFASSAPVSFTWFFAWRFLSGLTGGIIMVLAASVVLPHTSAARRGIVGGVIFAGVGLGVAASGTLVPLLLQQGLQQSWYGLGVFSAALTLASWWNWPAEAKTDAAPSHQAKQHHASPATLALLIQYGLNAVALVPHMVFIVDFVARGLGQGIAAGSHYWVLYGLGAIVVEEAQLDLVGDLAEDREVGAASVERRSQRVRRTRPDLHALPPGRRDSASTRSHHMRIGSLASVTPLGAPGRCHRAGRATTVRS